MIVSYADEFVNRRRFVAADVVISQYYQLPKFLFSSDFSSLSNDSRILYALLKDRHELSLKNGWIDDSGFVYFYFPRREMQLMLNLADKTITKAMQQLKSVDLVYEKFLGLGKPNRIYLLMVDYDCDFAESESESVEITEDVLNRKLYDSRGVKFTIAEQ
jgi:hypothetical protein